MSSSLSPIRPVGVQLYLLPIETRVPLKFGAETLTSVTCARVAMTVAGPDGRRATGWGETPLSVQWVWPSRSTYQSRYDAMIAFSQLLATAWLSVAPGHPLEVGYAFQQVQLRECLADFNRSRPDHPMPWLAALVCASPFDIALHDAYGTLLGRDIYDCYGPDCLGSDLACFLESATAAISFVGRYPADFLVPRRDTVPVWHLVGGRDPLDAGERDGSEPDDGHPVTLVDWIDRDGLKCLKIKLRGDDADWDYARIVSVGRIGLGRSVDWLTVDFNCTVTVPAYVCGILDRLMAAEPRIYGMILYVEQPFPYELEEHPIDVHAVSARKPLFMDESAHDWQHVRIGRSLGWTGVALKTCKTQTGALLSLCWAKAHGMTLMVQDLTNPMLAQIPHLRLGCHAGTIMGVESNGMQFYPAASDPEAVVHPGCYQRRNGMLDLSTIGTVGFGYRLDEIQRELPPAAVSI